MEQLTNPFKSQEMRAKKRLFSPQANQGGDLAVKFKLQSVGKKLLLKTDFFIRQLKLKYKPAKYDDASEDPQVQEVKQAFKQLMDKSSQQEIKNIIIPQLDRVMAKARLKHDSLKREYMDCRREALSRLEGSDAMDIIMDNYEQALALDKKAQREIRGQITALAWTDLDALKNYYWKKQLKVLLENPQFKDEAVEKLQVLIRQAGDKMDEMNDIGRAEREEEDVQLKKV